MLVFIICFIAYLFIAHYISYKLEKERVLKRQTWDLNICCGKTDGGGVNADIFAHSDLPNFTLVNDIYNLPFKENEFKDVLCSHTIEHVDDPKKFYDELSRVGESVTVVVPPLYDLGAVLNIFEHRYIFLCFKKEHKSLPPHIHLPFAELIQRKVGQINHA